jgi:hypothetical protein
VPPPCGGAPGLQVAVWAEMCPRDQGRFYDAAPPHGLADGSRCGASDHAAPISAPGPDLVLRPHEHKPIEVELAEPHLSLALPFARLGQAGPAIPGATVAVEEQGRVDAWGRRRATPGPTTVRGGHRGEHEVSAAALPTHEGADDVETPRRCWAPDGIPSGPGCGTCASRAASHYLDIATGWGKSMNRPGDTRRRSPKRSGPFSARSMTSPAAPRTAASAPRADRRISGPLS